MVYGKTIENITRGSASGRSGGARKETQKMARRRNLGTVLIMYQKITKNIDIQKHILLYLLINYCIC